MERLGYGRMDLSPLRLAMDQAPGEDPVKSVLAMMQTHLPPEKLEQAKQLLRSVNGKATAQDDPPPNSGGRVPTPAPERREVPVVQGKPSEVAQDDPEDDDDEDTAEPGTTVLGAPGKIQKILAAIEKHGAPVELLNTVRAKLYALIGQPDPQAPAMAQDSYAMDEITKKMLKRATKPGRLFATDHGWGGRFEELRAAERAVSEQFADIRTIRRV